MFPEPVTICVVSASPTGPLQHMNLDQALDQALPASASPAPATHMPLRAVIREGLRASVLRRPVWNGAGVRTIDLALLLAIECLIQLGLSRLEIRGAAGFSLQIWLYQWWPTTAFIWVAWTVLPKRAGLLSSYVALMTVAETVPLVVFEALRISQAYGLLDVVPLQAWAWLGWAIYLVDVAWYLAIALCVAGTLGTPRKHLAALLVCLAAMQALSTWQSLGGAWRAKIENTDNSRPEFVLSQEVFEAQQAVWKRSVEALAPQRAGVADVYALVFAPYAQEDVFLRESTMVARLLESRFDAQGRVLHLANHASATQELPWATPLNLQRAVEALGSVMDRENDLLVVYMTSHGANNHKLAASHWPLNVGWLTPEDLRSALDAAGIKHRVVAISACYSGGWIEPLANADTLVMTAADATHTSYGCGSRSELTFFGRAVFDEQLRSTHSFEDAFAKAVPVIRQREEEAGKDDGFSNPQISVGESIKPRLEGIRQRLDTGATPAGG